MAAKKKAAKTKEDPQLARKYEQIANQQQIVRTIAAAFKAGVTESGVIEAFMLAWELNSPNRLRVRVG